MRSIAQWPPARSRPTRTLIESSPCTGTRSPGTAGGGTFKRGLLSSSPQIHPPRNVWGKFAGVPAHAPTNRLSAFPPPPLRRCAPCTVTFEDRRCGQSIECPRLHPPRIRANPSAAAAQHGSEHAPAPGTGVVSHKKSQPSLSGTNPAPTAAMPAIASAPLAPSWEAFPRGACRLPAPVSGSGWCRSAPAGRFRTPGP